MGGGGLLVDTPGFNQPDVFLPAADLASYFPEIGAALAASGPCAFANCQHLSEPGCAARGDWERYELYAGMHAEMRALEAASAGRSLDKRRREGTTRAKSRAGGQVGLEARLETKTHRRVSRREVNQRLADLVKDAEDPGESDISGVEGS
jgi:ribosome biogenesis GTPase